MSDGVRGYVRRWLDQISVALTQLSESSADTVNAPVMCGVKSTCAHCCSRRQTEYYREDKACTLATVYNPSLVTHY